MTGEAGHEILNNDMRNAASKILAAPSSGRVVKALNMLGWDLRWEDPDLSFHAHARALELTRLLGYPATMDLAADAALDAPARRGRFDEAIDVCTEVGREVLSVHGRIALEQLSG